MKYGRSAGIECRSVDDGRLSLCCPLLFPRGANSQRFSPEFKNVTGHSSFSSPYANIRLSVRKCEHVCVWLFLRVTVSYPFTVPNTGNSCDLWNHFVPLVSLNTKFPLQHKRSPGFLMLRRSRLFMPNNLLSTFWSVTFSLACIRLCMC